MMKRRDFSRACGAALAGATLLPAVAQQRFDAGKDYLPLDKPAPVDAPSGKIEVVEFFWYNCPHCNAFEPTLETWIRRAPKDVVIRRVPVAFSSAYQGQQRLYYALEAMNLVDKVHAKVFQAIHVERKPGSHRRLGRHARRGQGQVHGAVQLLHCRLQDDPRRPADQCLQGGGRTRDGRRRALLYRWHPYAQHGAFAAGGGLSGG
jgi:thiol-disulfide isomerase/thioredoxin